MTRAYAARPAGRPAARPAARPDARPAAPTAPAERPRPPAQPAAEEPAGLAHPPGRVPAPWRITVALGLRSGPQVDRALGGREPMVDRWEAGLLIPTPWQVHLLAAYTGYPVDWFYEPEPEPWAGGWVCYGRKVDGARCHPMTPARPQPTEGVLF